MSFAIVGYFDKKSHEKIKSLWGDMEKIGVDHYLVQSENNPHIKFAMYEDMDVKEIEQLLISIAKMNEKIGVQFKTYSFYPNEKPFVCIDVAVSQAILNLQTEIRSKCDLYAKVFPIDFFEQGIWKPDCQLTIEFEKEKLLKAVDFLSNTKLPFNGMIEKIGVIEFHPAKQLFSYELI